MCQKDTKKENNMKEEERLKRISNVEVRREEMKKRITTLLKLHA